MAPSPWESIRREDWRAVTSSERYTYGFEPLPEEYTEREGTYYHIDTFVTGSKRIRQPILRLNWVGRVDELLERVAGRVHEIVMLRSDVSEFRDQFQVCSTVQDPEGESFPVRSQDFV